jgi:hypothetical protein
MRLVFRVPTTETHVWFVDLDSKYFRWQKQLQAELYFLLSHCICLYSDKYIAILVDILLDFC